MHPLSLKLLRSRLVAVETTTPSLRSQKKKYLLLPVLILPPLMMLVKDTSFC